MSAYLKLEQLFEKLNRFEHALTILHWDQEVMMPPGGEDARAKSISELSAYVHSQLCRTELGDWFASAELESDLDTEQLANLKEMKRSWLDSHILPEELVREQSIAASRCQQAWRTQRQQNDWSGFKEFFTPVVSLAREQAKIRQQAFGHDTPYDAMLDMYSVGDGSKLINTVFTELKNTLPEFIKSVLDRQKQTQRPKLTGTFSVAKQQQLSFAVMKFLGFEFQCGRLDVSTHPFSTGNFGDQRITTRFNTKEFIEALYATIHETGHARYEAGLPQNWQGQPVGRARNMSIHESQSLFFEKHIGCNKAFCSYLAQQASDIFQMFPQLSAEHFHQNVTWVEPGLIRVNADELTYPLHVILRFEIESALINGEMEIDDIPVAWHDAMRQYLGLSTDKNYKDGCMQDVHWPSGAFGYFPSYTLGAVNAAQLRYAITQELGTIDEYIEQGNIQPISDWLNTHIWSLGSLYSSQDMMQNATGSGTNARYLIDHLQTLYQVA